MNKKKNARDNKSVPTNHRRIKRWTKTIAIQTITQIRMLIMQTATQTRVLIRMQRTLQTATQAKIQTQTTAATTIKKKKGTFLKVPFLLTCCHRPRNIKDVMQGDYYGKI